MEPFWIHLELLAEFGIPPNHDLVVGVPASSLLSSSSDDMKTFPLLSKFTSLNPQTNLQPSYILCNKTIPSIPWAPKWPWIEFHPWFVVAVLPASSLSDWTRDGQRHPKKTRGNGKHVFLVPDFVEDL